VSSYEAPHLYDLVDRDELSELQAQGYVREVFHPDEPLAILNYTDKAQVNPKVFAEFPSLNLMRGLIYNTTDGTVVARPFPKFWNYGQTGAAQIPLGAHVIVTDKVDGSLGVAYVSPTTGRTRIATRGSFTSDQALHATKLLEHQYASWRPAPGQTALFEIVYPENRIVLDYAGLDDLILLGSVEIRRGYVSEPGNASYLHGWKAARTNTFTYNTLAEALAVEPRVNAEGFVVLQQTLDGDRMVKIKQEDYVILHRIVTGLNERTVWEHLKAGKPLIELLEPLPDEFHSWVLAVARRLFTEVAEADGVLQERYLHYVRQMSQYYIEVTADGAYEHDKRAAAKHFAELVKPDPAPWAMFALRQGKDIEPKLWDLAKPEPGKNPSNTPLEA